MLFMFHPALPAQVAPLRIHIGGGVLEDLIQELNLEEVNLEEVKSHTAVVQQVILKVEDVVIHALLVRGGRVIQLADR
jgi:hypothetical protein